MKKIMKKIFVLMIAMLMLTAFNAAAVGVNGPGVPDTIQVMDMADVTFVISENIQTSIESNYLSFRGAGKNVSIDPDDEDNGPATDIRGVFTLRGA